MSLAKEQAELEGRVWSGASIHVVSLRDQLDIIQLSKDMLEHRDRAWVCIADCYKQLGDTTKALAYSVSVAKSSGWRFPEAWLEIQSITGLLIPERRLKDTD